MPRALLPVDLLRPHEEPLGIVVHDGAVREPREGAGIPEPAEAGRHPISRRAITHGVRRRSRIAACGSAAALIAAGAVCAIAVSGGTGQLLALALIGIGLVALTSLAFLEVGLSEDRERSRELEANSRERGGREGRTVRPKLGRSRGHRRRLG